MKTAVVVCRLAWKTLGAAVLLLAGTVPKLSGAELRIEGDRLTLRAEQEPIPAVLAAFARQGVRVKLDPAVTGTVTIDARRQDAEAVLRAMLANLDYLAVWRRVPGPLGSIPVLEELQVYRPGRKEAAQPLASAAAPTNRVLKREIMAGELLVRAAASVSPESFLQLIAQRGGRVADSIPSLGLYKIVFPPDTDIPRLAEELSRGSLIAAAEPNYVYRLPASADDPPASAMAPPAAPVQPASAGGKPRIAVLDTGFGVADDSLVSWLDAAGNSPAPVDLQGHGTQMALLAEGRLQPLGGSLPGRDLPQPVLAVRIAAKDAYVAGDTLMKSLQAAIDQEVRVVSLSWGSDMESAFLRGLLEQAMAKGIVVVAAAGNAPTGNPVYPAAFPGVLAAGGAGPDGKPAAWSNYGNFLSLSAPGYAPLPAQSDGVRKTAVGTSVSTAYTAHVLGRYFELHPEATAAQALTDLRRALTDIGTPGWDAHSGNGLLDAAAVSRLLQPNK